MRAACSPLLCHSLKRLWRPWYMCAVLPGLRAKHRAAISRRTGRWGVNRFTGREHLRSEDGNGSAGDMWRTERQRQRRRHMSIHLWRRTSSLVDSNTIFAIGRAWPLHLRRTFLGEKEANVVSALPAGAPELKILVSVFAFSWHAGTLLGEMGVLRPARNERSQEQGDTGVFMNCCIGSTAQLFRLGSAHRLPVPASRPSIE
jgi:hypothetical protein